MSNAIVPTDDEIRTALLGRCEEFSALTGAKKTAIGKAAVNDGAFVSQLANGRNITLGTYRRMMAWLDENWPEGRS